MAPTREPIVANAKIFPEFVPEVSTFLETSLIANGVTVPNNKKGTPKNKIEAIKGPHWIPKLSAKRMINLLN